MTDTSSCIPLLSLTRISMTGWKTWALIVTVVHFGFVVFHAAAHRNLQIELAIGQLAFVVAFVIVGPLLAMAMVSRWIRAGSLTLSLTMLGSLVFGIYFHFIAVSDDNVWHLAEMHSVGASELFTATAYLLVALEAVGTVIGAVLYHKHAATR